MKRFRKRIALVVIVALFMSMLPMDNSAKAASTLTSGGWEYSINEDGTVTITGTTEECGELNLPNKIEGRKVTSIGDFVFSGCSGLTGSLTIPEGVTSIGKWAFDNCSGLTGSLTIPEGVTSIGYCAFRGCSGLTGSLTIPEGVTSIGDKAFYNCSGLTGSLTILEGVTSIGDEAFCDCSGLTGSLTIPEGVTSIGDSAFSGCKSLTGSLTISKGVMSIGYGAFRGCSGLTGNLIIPEGITSIEGQAFLGCSGLTGSLTIPVGVTSIGYGVFSGCSGLTGSLTIPVGVTSIGDYAFSGCKGLTGSLTIPEGVASIGDYAFYNCSGLTGSLTIPEGVASIGDRAFYNCSGLTGSLTIPEGVTSIGAHAFDNCSSLTGSLTIPEGVTSIGDYAFYGCEGLSGEVVIPEGVDSVGDSSFGFSKLVPVCIVQFKDWNGELLGEIQKIAFEGNATPPEEPNTKKGYHFSSWDKVLTDIKASQTVTAQYEKNEYTVTFCDSNDKVISTQKVKYQESAAPPTPPTVEGKTFSKWSTDEYLSVTKDLTIKAIYEASVYNVIFKDWNGTQIGETQKVEYGKDAIEPESPNTKEGYHFIGWDKDLTNIKQNTTITAQYEKNEYTVTFCDSNDKVISTQKVKYQESAAPPTPPTVEGKTFSKWSTDEYLSVTKDLKIKAIYEASVYNVIFKDWNGTQIGETQKVEYGKDAVEPESPNTKKGYHFVGWDKDLTNIKQNITITAQYEKNEYTVTFCDSNNNVISTQKVKYQESATPPTPPDVEGKDFYKWSTDEYLSVTKDLTVTAIYGTTVLQVTFKDWDGSQIGETQKVLYGDNVTAPEEPNTKEGYHFVNWDKPLTNIKESQTITAQYLINEYTIRFLDYDGNDLCAPQKVKHGEKPVVPDSSLLEKEGVVFTGWDSEVVAATADKVYKPKSTIASYTVIFYDEAGGAISTQIVNYKEAAVAPELSEVDGKDFVKWDTDEYLSVTRDLVVRPIYKTKTYEVKFMDWDGKQIGETQNVLYDDSAIAPEEPNTKEGYHFVKWDKPLTNIKENQTITAQYEINVYTITFIDDEGDLIDESQKVEFGKMPKVPDVSNLCTENKYFAGWDQEVLPATKDIVYKACFVYEYEYEEVGENSIEITKHNVIEGARVLTLPDNIDGYDVVGIKSGAFVNDEKLEKIYLSSRISNIESQAFTECTNLKYVYLPNYMEKIEENAFPDGTYLFGEKWADKKKSKMTEGYRYACEASNNANFVDLNDFKGEELESDDEESAGAYALVSYLGDDTQIVIPDYDVEGNWYGVVNASAFAGNTNIETIVLPENAAETENGAFEGCTTLRTVGFQGDSFLKLGDNTFNNCRSLYDISLPSGMTDMGKGVFKACRSLKNITIPEQIKDISDEAFMQCYGLKSVKMLTKQEEGKKIGCESVGDKAFSGCTNLENIQFASTVKIIGKEAFEDCALLSSIELNDGLKSIGYNAFKGCINLKEIEIPGTVLYLSGGQFFEGCKKLKHVILNEGLIKIGNDTFKDCAALELINVPATVTNIGNSAFENCTNLKNIIILEGVGSLGDNAFKNSGLEEISIPGSCKSIGDYAFANGSTLKNVVLKEGIESLGSNTFENCVELGSIQIPGTAKSMQKALLKGCINLQEVIIPASISYIADDVFADCDMEKLVIISEVGSNAEEYAKEQGIKFGNINTTISLNQDSATLDLALGETLILTAIVENADASKVQWTSSKETVAIVDNGKVIPKGVGEAVISASINGKIATCLVKVENNAKPTATPTATPTVIPTATPTVPPTATPTATPTVVPTVTPTVAPTATSTVTPTATPTATPTVTPTVTPTITPTETPALIPEKTPAPQNNSTIKQIALGKVKILKAKSKKKRVTLTWKKINKAIYYRVEYALDKKMKKSKKVVRVFKTKYTTKKLKKNKKYYFRIRAYRIDSNGVSMGKWSKVKCVKAK